MQEVADYCTGQCRGEPAEALQLLRGVQTRQPAAAQDGLARAFAQSLQRAGTLDRPPAGDRGRQAAAIQYFRQILARPPDLTAEQLRRILPGSGHAADVYAPLLTYAMAANGINSPTQRAAFLAQLGVESGNLQTVEEDLNYKTPAYLVQNFSAIGSLKEAKSYIHKPEALANHVYAGRNGNGDEQSGDGWLFRGRGLIQITGRENYRKAGHESDPDVVVNPNEAAMTAASYWSTRGLNDRSAKELDYAQFYAVVGRVNAGHKEAGHRWQAYQRALDVLGARSKKP